MVLSMDQPSGDSAWKPPLLKWDHDFSLEQTVNWSITCMRALKADGIQLMPGTKAKSLRNHQGKVVLAFERGDGNFRRGHSRSGARSTWEEAGS